LKYTVIIKKKVYKRLCKCPKAIADKFSKLYDDLENQGPTPKGWANLGKIRENYYHCHLSYHWIACWYCKNKNIEIEVYYVGSREKAPY